MKYLVMCEGPNEKKIMELLLMHDKLKRDISRLTQAIREYKQRNHSHKADEHYLVELLKSSFRVPGR